MTEYKDKICRQCIYGDKTEYEKPCVVYSDDCKFFKPKRKELLIQEYTNNGLMIADIFNITDTKNVKTSINDEQNLIEVCGDGFTMWFDIDWWDAPYEKDYIPKNILDKIRAEIEFEVDHRTNMLCAEDVFEIIDRYKAESEAKKDENF